MKRAMAVLLFSLLIAVNAWASDINELRVQAERGDVAAQSALGMQYVEGRDVEQDNALAVEWLTKAAEHGAVEAQYQLAKVYAGMPGLANNKLAEKWYLVAAENGDARAQYDLGFRYLTTLTSDLMDGTGPGLHADAFKWLLKAAEQGDDSAYYWVGEMYFKGQGVKRNYDEAYKWLSKAAEQRGGFLAQSVLYEYYEDGQPIRKVEDVEARANAGDKAAIQEMVDIYRAADEVPYYPGVLVKWILKLDDVTDARDQSLIGYSYKNGVNGLEQNDAEAVKWLTKAAENGDEEAALIIVEALLTADLGLTRDEAKAVEWLNKLANNGSTWARKRLADLYIQGFGVPQDYHKAVEWLTLIANGNDRLYQTSAQSRLGDLYAAGIGIEQDYAKAFKWYQKAAESGQSQEKYQLAEMYVKGLGTEQDYAKAIELYNEAKYSDDAKLALQRIYYQDEVTEPDYARAFELAQELADKRKPYGFYALALAYYEGKGTPKDNVAALTWLQKVFSSADVTYNDLDAARALAVKLDKTATAEEKRSAGWQTDALPSYDDGRPFCYDRLLQLAQNNDATAQYELALRFFDGAGLKQDNEKGFQWLNKAVENNCTNAHKTLAGLLFYGERTKTDNKKAMLIYFALAENGDADSQFFLGKLYLTGGNGVSKNLDKAHEWLMLSAEQNVYPAQILLSDLYRFEKKKYRNMVEAFVWRVTAYYNQNSYQNRVSKLDDEFIIDILIEQMDKEELEEALILLKEQNIELPNFLCVN